MIAAIRSVAALLTGLTLLLVGNGLFGTVLALRMGIDGFSTLEAGFVLSTYFAGLTVGSLLAAQVVQRVGHVRAFSAFAGMAAGMALLHMFVPHPAGWALFRAVLGFQLAGLFVVTESWLNHRCSDSVRGTVLAVYMVVSQLALGIGQVLVPAFDPATSSAFVFAGMLYALALVPVSLTRAPQPEIVLPKLLGLREVWERVPLALIGCTAAGLTTGSLLSLGPVFVARASTPAAEAGLFMAAIVFGGMVLQWPVGRWSDRIDRRTVIAAVAGALAFSSVLVSLSRTAGQVVGVAAVVGGLAFTLYPLHLAHANDVLTARDRFGASGTMLLAYGCGATAGPLIASLFMTGLGPRGLFYWIAGVGLTLVGAALGRKVVRRPAAEHAPYQPVALPQTLPSPQLDPRVETPESHRAD